MDPARPSARERGPGAPDTRILFDVTRSSTTVHVAVDLVLVGRGHTEITLTTTSPLEAGPTRQAVETKLARDLAARAF
jgi:hypothetical protein